MPPATKSERHAAAGRASGQARRRPTAERLASEALDLLVDKLAAERPPLTPRQRTLLLAVLGDDTEGAQT